MGLRTNAPSYPAPGVAGQGDFAAGAKESADFARSRARCLKVVLGQWLGRGVAGVWGALGRVPAARPSRALKHLVTSSPQTVAIGTVRERIVFDGPNHRSFRSQIVAALVLLGVFGAAPVIVVGVHSVARIDDDAAARETMQVSAAIAARFDHLPTEQRSASIWDDAVIAAQAGDVAWIEANLGVWMQTYFGHDLNFVLSPALEPVYAAIGGETRDPAAFAAVADPVLALARDARATVLAGEVDPAEIAATDHVALPDGPAVVSVVPIVPDTDTVTVAPEAMSFHVAVDMSTSLIMAKVTSDRRAGVLK
ncbi:CHASE4 domain-containing protein [Citreimonas sp.]|uniref:CHASE4 domain-containing protein n=1 Tax=Citreimonas sp. TaxID=3036715 RepID=UPI004059ED55